MKISPTSPMVNMLAANVGEFIAIELYTVTFRDGSEDYFNNFEFDIPFESHTFKGHTLRFEGLKFKLDVGWQVDEQDLKISAYPGETLGGASFFVAVQSGLLDGAYIKRQRGFALSTGIPSTAVAAGAFLEVVTISTMRVSTITKIGRTHVEMKLKSPMVLLDLDMPRNTYGPGCQWTLFDSGCTLVKGDFTFSSTVMIPGDSSFTVTGGIPSPTGADGFPTYAQGRLVFTSGANANLQVSIGRNDATSFFFSTPPVKGLQVGDTFDAWPGCSKTDATCTLKFNNFINFRGFPRVPPIVLSV